MEVSRTEPSRSVRLPRFGLLAISPVAWYTQARRHLGLKTRPTFRNVRPSFWGQCYKHFSVIIYGFS
jgi:hypothetical protein